MGYPAQIFRSANHGQSWSCYSTVYGNVSKLLFDPVDPTIVYALMGYGLSRSTDGGRTWSGINFSFNHYARDFVLDPSDHTIIHAVGYVYDQSSGAFQMGYWRRAISGSTWTDLTPATISGYAYAIEIESGNTQNIYIGGYTTADEYTYTGRLYRSTNGGTSFTDVTGPVQGFVLDIAADPLNPGRVFIATSGYVYRSTDRGDSWSVNNGYIPSPASIQVAGTSVYVGSYSGVYKGNGGLDYALLSGSNLRSGSSVLMIEPSSPHGIFFANN